MNAIFRKFSCPDDGQLYRPQTAYKYQARKNQATSTPDRKWQVCSTNCPELCQD